MENIILSIRLIFWRTGYTNQNEGTGVVVRPIVAVTGRTSTASFAEEYALIRPLYTDLNDFP